MSKAQEMRQKYLPLTPEEKAKRYYDLALDLLEERAECRSLATKDKQKISVEFGSFNCGRQLAYKLKPEVDPTNEYLSNIGVLNTEYCREALVLMAKKFNAEKGFIANTDGHVSVTMVLQ